MQVVIHTWSKAPFIRVLFPLIGGIIVEWHLNFSLRLLVFVILCCLILFLFHFLLSLKWKFRLQFIHGILFNVSLLLSGAILLRYNDIRHDQNNIVSNYTDNKYAQASLEEPLSAKTNSYKAAASVNFIADKNKWKKIRGTLIIYFKKDSLLKLDYGSRIIFKKPLQEIKNTGNPGGFDYKQYCLFQGITHQVYLDQKDFIILSSQKNYFHAFIFDSRDWVLKQIRRFIKGEKEQGLAEALLIGYKDDLDKNLVQSYSNTGVVHVIAISGLHLGLIYWILLICTKPLTKFKRLVWLRLFLVITCIWWFSILAGAQPSVLRSAVMFSFLAMGEVLSRRSSIYNSLALSAFVLLCYNPFWLWDVGFQLSYSAVLSIVIFFKPIYNWFYFKNKLLDFIWKLNAVTIAAQLLTLPFSIYHFHQVPCLFLLTNLVAVPLSSAILMGEILVCVCFFILPFANFLGWILKWLIWLMNTYIEHLERLPFSVWTGISINLQQAVLLMIFIIAFAYWLIENRKTLLWLAFASLLFFTTIHSYTAMKRSCQKKIIVYNIAGHKAADLVAGNSYEFISDSSVANDKFLRNFNISPSRTLHG
ncbi:MAG: ComEC/Rec2 family competence protein, partial [Flavisolibacter sp.]